MKSLPVLFLISLASCSTASSPGQKPSGQPGAGRAPLVAALGPVSFAALGSKQITRAAMIYPTPQNDQPEVPMSLTASDGTGLELIKLDARAVVDGPLAYTELHLSFKNPQDRVLEGRFQITLPEGASIGRLAMQLESGWQEAEIVEKQLARRAYEDFLHRKQDPMLLEKEAGNQFRARIFPIPARGEKHVIISYSQELAKDEPYKLHLVGLPRVAELGVSALVAKTGSKGGYRRVVLKKSSVVPDKDFTVTAGGPEGLRYRDLVALRVRPTVNVNPAPAKRMAILFDTSASRAPGFARQVDKLGALVSGLEDAYGGDLELVVAAFDQEVARIFDGKVSAFANSHLSTLRARRPLGASNPVRALHWLSRLSNVDRVVLVTDGIATSGDELSADAAQTLAGTVRRLDVVLVGGIRDREGAIRIAQGPLEVPGVVIDGDDSSADIVRRLRGKSTSGVTVSIPGSAWVWPNRLDAVQAGDEFTIYAAMAKGQAPRNVSVQLGAPGRAVETQSIRTQAVSGPLLERASAGAHIRKLESQLMDAAKKDKNAIKARIIALSVKHRVLSDHTALLVLETEADYQRYGIDRKALADILVVDEGGLSLVQRTKAVMIVAKPPAHTVTTTKDFKKAKPKKESSGKLAAADKITIADGIPIPEPPPPPPAPRSEHSPDEAESDRGAEGQDDTAQPSDAPAGPSNPRPRQRQSGQYAMRNSQEVAAPDPNALAAAEEQLKSSPPALTGEFAAIAGLTQRGDHEGAVIKALAWRTEKSGDVMALVALGEALEGSGNPYLAARAYGSIIDLFPSRADLRRFAGTRLQRLGPAGHELAVDSLAKAAKQRPDHLSVHRLYAYALVRAGRFEEAFAALESGLARDYPSGRFRGGKRILAEDLGIVAAAWSKSNPDAAGIIAKRLKARDVTMATKPSLRFVLNWETDANDVDFHIYDAKGGHAFYSQKQLPSGGSLYEDVTTGYGPECFTIDGPPKAFPYRLVIHYYSRGPMGYGMGQLEILQHDGAGGLKFGERPFVVMNDGAYLDLGSVNAPL